jgi:hypothetical protein
LGEAISLDPLLLELHLLVLLLEVSELVLKRAKISLATLELGDIVLQLGNKEFLVLVSLHYSLDNDLLLWQGSYTHARLILVLSCLLAHVVVWGPALSVLSSRFSWVVVFFFNYVLDILSAGKFISFVLHAIIGGSSVVLTFIHMSVLARPVPSLVGHIVHSILARLSLKTVVNKRYNLLSMGIALPCLFVYLFIFLIKSNKFKYLKKS